MKPAILIFICLVFSAVAQADDSIPNLVTSCLRETCVEGTGNVWLRASPPGRLFNKKGAPLAIVEATEILVVTEKKYYNTIQ